MTDVTGQSEVLEFFNEHGAEGAAAVEQSFDNADSQQRVDLKVSGRYRMKVTTFGYVKDNVFKAFPNIYTSAKKKALMLSLSLRVVDGTDVVPKGASIFHNITLAPAAGAKPETIEAIARISKPQLVALYGKDDVKANPKWLVENCLPKFEKDGDKYTLVKDHNLQSEVMVEVVDDYYNNRETLRINSIFPASPADKSVSNVSKNNNGTVADVSGSDEVISDSSAEDIAAAALGDDAITPEDVTPIEAGADDDSDDTIQPNSETSDF